MSTSLTTLNQLFKDLYTKYNYSTFCAEYIGYRRDDKHYSGKAWREYGAYLEQIDHLQPHIQLYLVKKWGAFKLTSAYETENNKVKARLEALYNMPNPLLKSIPKIKGFKGSRFKIPFGGKL